MDQEGLESKPKMSKLQRLVKPHLAKRWEELGTALGLADEDDGEELDKIRASRSGDSSMCFNDTMKIWLRSAPSASEQPVTWATLIEAIKSIGGLEPVAAQIEAQLMASLSSSCLTEFASTSKPSNPTPQLPPTIETSPITASVVQPPGETLPLPNDVTTTVGDNSTVSAPNLPADETAALSSDDFTSSSQDSLSSPGSDEDTSPSPPGEPEDSQVQETSQEPENLHETKMMECESIPASFDYTLKLDPGKQIREYQRELAEPGINGENYIVVAPTGSGKTLVAALVISDHLDKNQHEDDKAKVVFIVNTKPLAEQQKKELEKFIPGAQVGCSMGDGGPSISDLLPHNNIIVCTAGKLLDAIKDRKVTFEKISLIVIDECHHTKKSSPQANVMLRYLQCKKKDPSTVPQVMGLTASPGAGNNPHRDRKITIDHLVNLCALMDATSGIKMVE